MAAEPRSRVESGVVVGTSGGKYEHKNPLARWLLQGYDQAAATLVEAASPSSILEVGCGEGHVTEILARRWDVPILACDLSDTVLREARARVPSPHVRFEAKSIYDLNPARDSADVVVCCEVLEHLDDPERGLAILKSLARRYAVLSVPWEPVFRTMNFLRGAYFWDFGNSPGHIQHWSRAGFLRFVSREFQIVQVRRPLPWTFVLGAPRGGRG